MAKINSGKIFTAAILILFVSLGMLNLLSKDAKAEKNLTSETLQGFGLYIDGELFAVLPTPEDIEQILSSYKAAVAGTSETKIITSVDFIETIEIRQVDTSPLEIKNSDQVLDGLIEGNLTYLEYEVEKEESVWLIAQKNNLTVQDVLHSNPGLSEEELLPPGKVLQLARKEFFLNVVAQGILAVTEIIPFEVETDYDPQLRPGSSIIKDLGKDGEAKVTYAYVEQNGEIIVKEPVEKQILAKPVKQIIYQGPERNLVTDNLSHYHGSGKISGMGWPLNGLITSYYGNRQGEFHTGIDIAGGIGQPYVAAAGGIVLQAAWQGNYGNTILLDHGDGVVTRYAHSLKLLVSPGEKVSKGQIIGYVGSTGRSNGPHVHFEVIINGKAVNPMEYLDT